MCRKQHGAAFRSRARVEISDFKWAQGEDLVTFYESTPGIFRGFCRVCGSPVINKFTAETPVAERDPKAPSRYGIALATLDDDPEYARPPTLSSPTRRRGLRSPTICRSSRRAAGAPA